jgi:hypothetical protein
LLSLQLVALVLLVVLYAISIELVADLFSPAFDQVLSPAVFAYLFSIVGVLLGVFFYILFSRFSWIKRYLGYAIPGVLLLIMLGTYLGWGVVAVYQVIVALVKIGFGFILSIAPLIGAYGLMTRHQNTISATSGGILFFFIFSRFLQLNIPENVRHIENFVWFEQVELLILFVVLFITFFELSTIWIMLKSALSKMTSSKVIDEDVLHRFNQIMTRYLLNIVFVFVVCFIATFGIVQYDRVIGSDGIGTIFGINLVTIYGMWFLILTTVFCAWLFWFLIPREKQKKEKTTTTTK